MTTPDLHAIAAVVYRFFAGLDARDHGACAALMAHDGVWHRQGAELVGPTAVLAALERRDPARQTAHLVTNLWIEDADASQARVRFYLSAHEVRIDADGRAGPVQLAGLRDCTDELVRQDGQWRIRSKTSRRLLSAE